MSAALLLRRGATAALLTVLAVGLGGCETVDKARMKLFGVQVCNPEPETAEWVLREALLAASDKDEETGWARFQKVLHSAERSPNALRGWREGSWKRMRNQHALYLDDNECFTLRDFKLQQNDGIDFFVENRHRDLPTPCAVYLDHNNNKLWRVKRCSL